MPTLFLLGDADLLIPVAGGPVRVPWGNRTVVRPPIRDTLSRWAAALVCGPGSALDAEPDGLTRERFAAPPGSAFEAVTVPGLGHHWPGGKGQFNPRLAGPTSDRLDANREIWSFFRRHRLE